MATCGSRQTALVSSSLIENTGDSSLIVTAQMIQKVWLRIAFTAFSKIERESSGRAWAVLDLPALLPETFHSSAIVESLAIPTIVTNHLSVLSSRILTGYFGLAPTRRSTASTEVLINIASFTLLVPEEAQMPSLYARIAQELSG